SESSSSVEESVKPEKPVAEPKITVTGTKLSKEETQKSESSSSVEESVKPEKPVAEPKITVTGTKLSKEEAQKLETQPRLSMSFVKNTSGNNIINAISLFKSLPQPSEGMDCKGVLEALDKVGISYEVVDSNTAVIKKAFGIYTYQYMDNSCK
ncbi:hypothetical protein L1286_22830, partial [Pseudoalteromonas sp. SMS1]|uniref:hypothetical protein n=1 Tax=Pseudoalteromonas sp. SMS1 TaxID=2908894 RepID=UPI001F2437DC